MSAEIGCTHRVESKDHYLTYAVFFAKDRRYGEVPYCDVDYGELEGDAVIRKLCFCGAPISYDEHEMSWVCSTSGEAVCTATKESLFVGPAYSEPLIAMTISPDLYVDDLYHPEKDSHLAVNEERQIHVFIKIPKKKVWMISDPLPIGNYFATHLLGSDLCVEWKLELGYDLPGAIDVSIPLSVFNERQKTCLGILSSGATPAYLHFLEKDSLSVIAHRRIIPNTHFNFSPIQKALELAERLPTKPEEREAILKDLSEERDWSMIETAYKLGLPQCTEFLRFFLGKGGGENFLTHVTSCQLCQKSLPQNKPT